MELSEWLDANLLKYEWIVETRLLTIVDDTFLHILPKEGKLFDENFDPIFDDEDLELIDAAEPKYICFKFGKRYYYSELGEPVKFQQLRYLGQANLQQITTLPHLGIHGEYEVCNGSGDYSDWAKKAKFLGVTTLGICERNTLAGSLKFQLACKEAGLKSIIGETVTVRDNRQQIYSVKLYAINDVGWNRLLWVNKAINVDNVPQHFVDEEYLLNHKAGLAIVFGSDVTLTEELLEKYSSCEHLYYQVDSVTWKSDDKDKRHLDNLKLLYDNYTAFISPILISDSYYLEQADFEVKDFLNKIGKVGFENQSEDQYFKTAVDIETSLRYVFKDKFDKFYEECVHRTIRLGELCSFQIPTGKLYLPKYELSEADLQVASDEIELFWHLIETGVATKLAGKPDLDPYLDRVAVEYEVIDSGKLQPYFLILQDIIKWAKSQGILVGRGRGSIGGSLISHLIDITHVDPLEFGLLFERFLNKGRISTGSFPDIDTDFQASRRDEVKRYIEQRYGTDNVCSIGTYGTFKLKVLVKDICRLVGVNPGTANYYSAMLDDHPSKNKTYEELFQEAVKNQKFKEFLIEYAEYVDLVPVIIGQPANTSVHAAGMVITPKELDGHEMSIYDWIPVKKIDGLLVSEWEGPLLEKAGFLKEDILGLTELDKFSDTLKLISAHGKEVPDLDNINLDDQQVFELFKEGHTQDVFQFNTPGLQSYCRDVRPDSVSELGAMNALYRPGPMNSNAHHDYVEIKFGRKEPEYDWGTKEVLGETKSLYIYQEQVMKLCQVLAGFSLAEADGIRGAIGKKDMVKMTSFGKMFVDRAIVNGCPGQDATKIWTKIVAFGQYSFGKAHAITYSILGETGQWLKCYYPLEFWATALYYAKDDNLPAKLHEISQTGQIKLISPDVNKSGTNFVAELSTNTIYWSLNKVRNVAQVATHAIISEREANGSFYSLSDFIKRVNKSKVNKTCVVNLILSGAFDELEQVTKLTDRKAIVIKFLQSRRDDVPVDLLGPDVGKEWFWYLKQRELSGSGSLDYTTLHFDEEVTKFQYCPPDKLLSSSNVQQLVFVTGILVEIIERSSKKGPFAHIVLDHNNATINVKVWSDTWLQYKELLLSSHRRIIAITGIIMFDKWSKRNVIYTQQDSYLQAI